MAVLNSILSYLQYCQILIQCSIASRFKNSQLIRLSCFVPLIRNNATSMAVFNIKKKKKIITATNITVAFLNFENMIKF